MAGGDHGEGFLNLVGTFATKLAEMIKALVNFIMWLARNLKKYGVPVLSCALNLSGNILLTTGKCIDEIRGKGRDYFTKEETGNIFARFKCPSKEKFILSGEEIAKITNNCYLRGITDARSIDNFIDMKQRESLFNYDLNHIAFDGLNVLKLSLQENWKAEQYVSLMQGLQEGKIPSELEAQMSDKMKAAVYKLKSEIDDVQRSAERYGNKREDLKKEIGEDLKKNPKKYRIKEKAYKNNLEARNMSDDLDKSDIRSMEDSIRDSAESIDPRDIEILDEKGNVIDASENSGRGSAAANDAHDDKTRGYTDGKRDVKTWEGEVHHMQEQKTIGDSGNLAFQQKQRAISVSDRER